MKPQVVTIILGFLATFADFANAQSGVLCEGSKLDEFTSNVDACTNLAELDFFSALISGDDILTPLCTSFEEKVKCWSKANSNLNCVTEEKLESITDNIKYDELKRAFNNSGSLGMDYVGNCQVLALYQRKVLQEVYGSAKCNIFEIFQIIEDRKECDDAINLRKKLLADIASTRSTLKSAVCFGYKGHERCQEPIYRCMSSDIEAETRNARAESWAADEAELREIPVFDDFRYSQCSALGSGGRNKRFAMMEEKVNLNPDDLAIFQSILEHNGDN